MMYVKENIAMDYPTCPLPEETEPEEEYLLRLSSREIKKIAYMAHNRRTSQERRNRPGDVELLEGIEEKVQRALLGI